MATKLATFTRINGHSSKMMTLREAMCPVCREIIIEPVTMPCKHIICLQCFEMTVEKSNLTCPLCRKRLGSWLRTATNKGKQLVNHNLWERIKTTFPDLVNAKLNGIETNDEIFNGSPKKRVISSPGEIRRDYEKSLEQAHKEEEIDRKKREEEEKASVEFIRQLQEEEARRVEEEARKAAEEEKKASDILIKKIQEEEERKQLQENEQARRDEELAKELQENTKIKKDVFAGARYKSQKDDNEIKKIFKDLKEPSSSERKKGPMDQFLMANRSLSNLSDCSHDSIVLETLHFFKPLKPFPITPPKQMPDGKLQKVPVVRAKPINLAQALDTVGTTDEHLRPAFSTSTLQKQLSMVHFQRTEDQGGSHTSAFSGRRTLFQECTNELSAGVSPRKRPRLAPHTITSADQSQPSKYLDSFPSCSRISLTDRPDLNETVPMDQSKDGSLERSEDSDATNMDQSDESNLSVVEDAGLGIMQAQQRLAEKMLKQERADFLLAQRLQKEFNQTDRRGVDRRKGTDRAYPLRKSGTARQTTLHETFGRRPSDEPSRPSTRKKAVARPDRSPVNTLGLHSTYSLDSVFTARPLDVRCRPESQSSLRNLLEANVRRFKEEEEQKRLAQRHRRDN